MKIKCFGIDDESDSTPITIRQKRHDELELEFQFLQKLLESRSSQRG
jgi:hypothetical protein